MIGQAQFTYTDKDMIATQRAGWSWFARWRNLPIAYVGIVIFTSALFAGLDARSGAPAGRPDHVAVIFGSAVETILLFGLIFWAADRQGREVLQSRKLGMPWNGDALGGEHTWAWDADELHMQSERGRADLAWTFVSAWLDAPEVLLLYPAGGRPFSVPGRTLTAGWSDSPKVFLFPFGGYALALPKRALAAGGRWPPCRRVAHHRRAGASTVRPERRQGRRRYVKPTSPLTWRRRWTGKKR